MEFYAVLDQVIDLLQRRGRASYRALRLQFQLDDEHLEALKEELTKVHQLAVDQQGEMLVWTGSTGVTPAPSLTVPQAVPQTAQPLQEASNESQPSNAERRQLTVLFCDLVDSTGLARQLDPEDLREVVRAYQETCAKVIARFDGHIAQYLGDGLLVYFGWPQAHEDDALRAVRTGLGIVEALGQLNTRLERERGIQLAVRLGIHTGLVVVGEVGGGTRQEQLALGETPNVAARLQGIAAPNTLVISAATFQLLGGFFACQPLGTPFLKGQAQPLAVYRVLYESMARSRLEAAGSAGLTPLVGREQEIGLLRERWGQVKEGVGHVVLLNGEGGIGKSRLVQVLQEQVATEPQAWLTPCQCSPYHQNTALYPMIELLERVALRFERDEGSQHKLHKLEGFLVQHGLPLAEAMPLFASLLSLPLPDTYAPLTLSPAQQKQKTLQALLTILVRIATQQPVLFVMEDLHWVDPTTIEFLTLVVDQGPTARILALWTFRPDFSPPWTGRSHLTQVTLPRLPRRQAAEMTDRVAHGKGLPPEVVAQIVAKTDGVPLFVEELTKMVLESGLLQERDDRYALREPLPPLAIPTTLHDSLMARLDRLATVKALAQLAATLGREFSYELLHAVSPWDEGTLGRGLHQLVEAEFLYQQGLPPEATYRFKHALIQDTACAVLAAQYPPAVPSAHCPGVRGPIPGDRRHATRAGRPALHRGGLRRAGRALLATGRGTCQRSLGLSGSHQPRAPWHCAAHDPARDACAYPPGVDLAYRPRRGPADHQRAVSARGGTGLHPGTRAVSAGGRDPRAGPGPVRAVAVLCDPAAVAHGTRGSVTPCCTWRTAPTTPHWRSLPTTPLGRRGCGVGRCLLPASIWRTASPATRQPSTVCRCSAWARIRVWPAAPSPRGPSGCSGTRRKPWPASTRPRRWRTRWRIPSVWRLRGVGRLSSFSCAGTCQPCTSRQRPPSCSRRSRALHSGRSLARACVGGRWPCRVRARRAWPRSVRGSLPIAPPGQRCTSPTFVPCWRTSVPTWATRKTASRHWPRPTP